MPKHSRKKWRFVRLSRWLKSITVLSFRLAFLAGIGFGVIWVGHKTHRLLLQDPYFQIQKITLYPGSLLLQPEYAFLEQELKQRNLFTVDLRSVSKRLEQNPKVQKAKVERILPNRINIFLTPRKPWIQVQVSAGGLYYLLGQDGVVMSFSKTALQSIWKMEDFQAPQKHYAPGDRYENAHLSEWPSFFYFLETQEVLQSEEIQKIAVDHLGNLSVQLLNGPELRFGGKGQMAPHVSSLLKTLLGSAERQQLLYIDLRYQDVIVKKKL